VMGELKDEPVHVHCIAQTTGLGFFYRYRRDVLGMDEARRAPTWKMSGSQRSVGGVHWPLVWASLTEPWRRVMSGTETGTALLEAARAFRPRLVAERDRIEASRRIPEDIARELARGGSSAFSCPKPMADSI